MCSPQNLSQRMLGGVGFVSIEMFGMFLLMTRANLKWGRILMVCYAIAVGFYWGIWSRWSPLREVNAIEPIEFNIMLALFFAVGLVILLLFLRVIRQHSVWNAIHLQLGQRGLGAVVIVCLVLLFVRFAQGHLNFGGMTVAGALLALGIGVLYYRKPEKAQMLMDKHFPPQPLHYLWVVLAGVIVAVSAFVSFHLPFY